MHQQHTILKVLVLGLAVAAVAAPMALADPAPRELGGNDRQIAPAVRNPDRAILAPDDLPLKRGASAVESEQNMLLAPDDRPRPAGQARGHQQGQSPVAIVPRAGAGFDWTAAGIGVVAGLVLVLIVGAASPAIRRRQHVHAAH